MSKRANVGAVFAGVLLVIMVICVGAGLLTSCDSAVPTAVTHRAMPTAGALVVPTAVTHRAVATADNCPLDDVGAYFLKTSAIMGRITDVLDDASVAQAFSDFGPLRTKAAKIRDDAEALDVPPCAAGIQRTRLEALDATVNALAAAEGGDLEAFTSYEQKATALFESAANQRDQLSRDLFGE